MVEKDFHAAIEQFEPIGLEEIQSVNLMDRVDVKYVIPVQLMRRILHQANAQYKVLEINGFRLNPYLSTYFDTSDALFYRQHQAGKLNRHKVRTRLYESTGVSFLEVKHKNNKLRTLKSRVEINAQSLDKIGEDQMDFLAHKLEEMPDELSPNLIVKYDRLTLINLVSKERITLDFNLSFADENATKNFTEVVIAEVKQARFSSSGFIDILRSFGLRSGSISKYCLGMISLGKSPKNNRFKSKLMHFNKIIKQNDTIAAGN